MHIKLNQLSIKKLVGIKQEKFNFEGSNVRIYGGTATGRSKTVVVLNSLLFEKNRRKAI